MWIGKEGNMKKGWAFLFNKEGLKVETHEEFLQ